jgi:hypothetical protein
MMGVGIDPFLVHPLIRHTHDQTTAWSKNPLRLRDQSVWVWYVLQSLKRNKHVYGIIWQEIEAQDVCGLKGEALSLLRKVFLGIANGLLVEVNADNLCCPTLPG